MYTHPAITEALASQHRRDLLSQADAYRPARAARGGHLRRPGLARLGRRPAGLSQPARRAVTAAGAVFAAAAVLMASPAGRWAAPNATAGHFRTPNATAGHSRTPQASAGHFATSLDSHWTPQTSHWTPQAGRWA